MTQAIQIGPQTDNITEGDVYQNSWLSLQPPGQLVNSALTALAQPGLFELNVAAGSILTLPPALGTGKIITAVVTTATTSVKDAILTSSQAGVFDTLIGVAGGSTVTTKAALIFSAAKASGFHSIQMPFAGSQPSGGFEGDTFVFTDLAPGVWLVEGTFQSGTTPTTPFSTATT